MRAELCILGLCVPLLASCTTTGTTAPSGTAPYGYGGRYGTSSHAHDPMLV